jgi:hypothetical protein
VEADVQCDNDVMPWMPSSTASFDERVKRQESNISASRSLRITQCSHDGLDTHSMHRMPHYYVIWLCHSITETPLQASFLNPTLRDFTWRQQQTAR